MQNQGFRPFASEAVLGAFWERFFANLDSQSGPRRTSRTRKPDQTRPDIPAGRENQTRPDQTDQKTRPRAKLEEPWKHEAKRARQQKRERARETEAERLRNQLENPPYIIPESTQHRHKSIPKRPPNPLETTFPTPKSTPKRTPNRPKIDPKSSPNRSQIEPKSASWGGPGGRCDSEPILAPFLAVLEAPGAAPGRSRGPLGAVLGRLGGVPGPPGAGLGASWGLPGAS